MHPRRWHALFLPERPVAIRGYNLPQSLHVLTSHIIFSTKERRPWLRAYGLFSISPSHRQATHNYVLDQEQHHQKETFQEEYLRILKKYGVEYDQRYLWD